MRVEIEGTFTNAVYTHFQKLEGEGATDAVVIIEKRFLDSNRYSELKIIAKDAKTCEKLQELLKTRLICTTNTIKVTGLPKQIIEKIKKCKL